MSDTWTTLHDTSSDYIIDAVAYRNRGTYYTVHHEYGESDPRSATVQLNGADFLEVVEGECDRDHELKKAPINAGCRYRRIWRPHANLQLTGETDLCVSAIEQMESLLTHLESIFRYVHPEPKNFATFGGEIRNLLILACTEVEAQWKGVLAANHAKSHRGFYTTRDYVKLLLPLRLAAYEVSLRRFPSLPAIAPFSAWTMSQPTRSLPWYDAYNKTKHDRESHLQDATLQHVLAAVAALPILTCAQFGKSAFDDHDVKKTFAFQKTARWLYPDYFYPPLKGDQWEIVDCDFEAYGSA